MRKSISKSKISLTKKSAIIFIISIVLLVFCGCSNLNLKLFDNSNSSINHILNQKEGFLEPLPDKSDKLIVDSIPALGGDSFLVLCQGKSMLIDAGMDSAYSEIDATLKSYNIDRIDIVIITHPHKDHIGGMNEVIEDYEIGKLYMIDEAYDSDSYLSLIDIIDKKKLDISYAKIGTRFNLGDASCFVLNPQQKSFGNINNNSIVFKMTFQDKSFLFTGDMEKKAEKALLKQPYDLKADFLKVGHHGRDDASSKKFLNAVSPEYAVISSKRNYSYDKILYRLLDKGVSVSITLDSDHAVYTLEEGEISLSFYPSLTY